ncbi:hypothetical protein DSC91_000912 [Paraburkholderia caffeinilytica]|uniref:NACHT domain-containing protein n=1 Tax=Paraburkholderia caffeinilytica TaxID=1761016 RepID=A0ABQ1N8D3_9BURK|nr:hypothetical protein [Paraburkholderia caffeinilytica]AXL49189.1 hypothetical protein DSC91_000912 [Paraburkholderia caffeinilytica]GGC57921.1 hypothetical protein GCM10011400_51990 [Paraburkholderia caffeinilytica]CAB3804906.1 hypothetical protein LMG28690_06140 [Paraburkholderia caffeinilytica]
MDHALENLGPEEFQHLCQALLIREFPGLTCFPVGQADGGRDALLLQDAEDSDKFNVAVFQVKFSRNPKQADEARDWVLAAAKGEIQKVKTLIDRGATKYFFITNVSGTSHLDVGSIDKLQNELTRMIGLPVTCWWRDDINRRLDNSWDIKLRYPQILTGSDFLRLLLETKLGSDQNRRLMAITAFLADQFDEDTEVKFKQVELQNKLLDLFVDLPFRVRLKSELESLHDLFNDPMVPLSVVEYASKHQVELHASPDTMVGTATLLLRTHHVSALGQLVVEGAPGQGKSTLAQYLCQVHRIRWLRKLDDLASLPDEHKTAPLCLPFKVDLRDLAKWIGGVDPFSQSVPPASAPDHGTLETFLAHLVKTRSGGREFSVDDLLAVAGVTPLFIVLDGLDEVAEIKRRGDIVSAVTKAANRLKETCASLRIIVTSRPSAFANSPGFDSSRFPTLELGSLQKEQIEAYAEKWMIARNLDHREQAEFRKILNERMEESHLRDLARNPMQLTILLSLILTRGAALPDKRTSLYDYYVDLFFSRESSKSSTVRKYSDLLRNIHGYLAWTLHSNAETDRHESAGRISTKDLHALLREYLEKERHGIEMLDEVFGATVERVFMIVSRIEGTYEFEVQPLREYFAARYLYDTAPYSPPGRERQGTKPDRFDAIARNPYWLNVVRFFCGCFSKGELQDLAERLKDLSRDASLKNSRYPIVLIAMLLSDWVFSQVPRAMNDLAEFISTRENIYKLLPDLYSDSDSSSAVRIPEMCGGNIVAEAVLSLIVSVGTMGDVIHRAVAFLLENCSHDHLKSLWIISADLLKGNNPARWAFLGREFKMIKDVSADTIEEMVPLDKLNGSDWYQIAAAARYDVLLASPARESKTLSILLDSIGPPDLEYSDSLYLVPVFLSVSAMWGYGRGKYVPEQLLAAVRRFRDASVAKSVSEQAVAPSLSESMRNVSERIAGCFKLDSSTPLTSVDELEVVVELMRQTWGERAGVILTALGLSQIPKTGRSKTCGLFDRNFSLSQRIRFAKSKAKNRDYWRSQLRSARLTEDIYFFHMLFAVFAPIPIVIEMQEETAASLDMLTNEQTARLLDLVNAADVTFERGGSNKQQSFDGTMTSAAQAWLTTRGSGRAFAKAVFLQYLRSSRDEAQQVVRFRQRWAIYCALDGDLPWDEALEIVRETYAKTFNGAIAGVSTQRKKAFPDSVMQIILENPADYPIGLWATVEAQATERGRQRTRPVGIVAKNDGWFAD